MTRDEALCEAQHRAQRGVPQRVWKRRGSTSNYVITGRDRESIVGWEFEADVVYLDQVGRWQVTLYAVDEPMRWFYRLGPVTGDGVELQRAGPDGIGHLVVGYIRTDFADLFGHWMVEMLNRSAKIVELANAPCRCWSGPLIEMPFMLLMKGSPSPKQVEDAKRVLHFDCPPCCARTVLKTIGLEPVTSTP